MIKDRIVNQSLSELGDWRSYLTDDDMTLSLGAEAIGIWLNERLPSTKFMIHSDSPSAVMRKKVDAMQP